jgi:hypothetical protein
VLKSDVSTPLLIARCSERLVDLYKDRTQDHWCGSQGYVSKKSKILLESGLLPNFRGGWEKPFKDKVRTFDKDQDDKLSRRELSAFIVAVQGNDDVEGAIDFFTKSAPEADKSLLDSEGTMTVEGMVTFFKKAVAGNSKRREAVARNLTVLGLQEFVDSYEMLQGSSLLFVCRSNALSAAAAPVQPQYHHYGHNVNVASMQNVKNWKFEISKLEATSPLVKCRRGHTPHE